MFKRTVGIVQLAFAILTFRALAEPPIQDPIVDYLAMNVPDRMTNVGRLLVVKKIAIDMEHNGKDDLFVGTWYRNSGPNTWLWAAYAPVAGGYKRLTPAQFDLLMAIQKGASLEGALETLPKTGPVPPIEKWFKNWSALGWFWM